MGDKPTAAFVLSLLGGIFVLVFGIIWGLIFSFGYFLGIAGILFLILALVFGILMIVGAVLMYVFPSQHVIWGVIVLIFSILSIFVAFGGFLVGMILGIIGGALGIAWKPGAGMGMYASTRVCMGCGRQIPMEYSVCPYCGTRAPAPGYGPPVAAPVYAPPPAPVPLAPPPAAAAPAPAAATKYCTSCGRPVQAGFPTCPYCGAKQPG